MPKVSVVMPVYNGEKYLREAMDSILGQTYTDFEFIIIDDGSKDSSAEIVRSYDDPRIRFYQNEQNMGVAATLNRGLDLATGEYIARMDADDISLPERFAKQVAYMDAHPDVAVCGSAIQLIGAQQGKRVFSQDAAQMKSDMFFASGIAHPTVMMRGCVFGGGGLHYDVRFSKMEDYALWVKVLEQHDIVSIPEVLLQYRIHPNQVTQNPSLEAREQSKALKLLQLKKLNAPTCGAAFDAFLKYCGSQQSLTGPEMVAMVAYLDIIKEANQKAKYYDQHKFTQSLDAVRRRALDSLPVFTAVKIANAAGINGVSYAFKRLIRSRRAALVNSVGVWHQRSKLKSCSFTILSNNCWGGFIYQKYGLRYNTPTIGLFIPGDDFVRFCADWQGYLAKDLRFIPWESTRLYPQIKNSAPYPVALLGDVEIYFMHYTSEEEAREKWRRRAKRINKDKLIFKLSQRECCGRSDVERFVALPLSNKVCFAYDDVPGAVVIPELRGLAGDETSLVQQHFDELEFLNRL